ncbi:hypothetical protein GKZ90_0021125 [Flavobacterium sp. MC2016-06]|jgi:hypothetical protein|uniref:hypothetical protein n=1 Tax=Flavobacterium sp. MC2016-06 TaxID=2676308 RepID=UPI0012BA5BDA|nr:hypothetical protein [Flavobacterium sp. MC2016-06]MBU3861004.1 hypothetical protein [Flavobacterium sp. MC2016-06]
MNTTFRNPVSKAVINKCEKLYKETLSKSNGQHIPMVGTNNNDLFINFMMYYDPEYDFLAFRIKNIWYSAKIDINGFENNFSSYYTLDFSKLEFVENPLIEDLAIDKILADTKEYQEYDNLISIAKVYTDAMDIDYQKRTVNGDLVKMSEDGDFILFTFNSPFGKIFELRHNEDVIKQVVVYNEDVTAATSGHRQIGALTKRIETYVDEDAVKSGVNTIIES